MHLFREERILGSIDNAARDIAAPVKRAGEVGDGRLKALYALQAGMNVRDIQKNQKTDKAINKNNAVGINISLGSTGWKDHAETVTEEARGSRITAGRTAAIIAKEDMTVKGSIVNAKDILLKAGNNIHILSCENKSTTIEDYKAKSGSIGASLSKGGYGIGASYGKGKGQIEETILTHTPSDITAKNTATLSGGNDTLIRGGTVKGNKIIANAGRMSIESEQDKKNYKETSKTSGLSISYTPGSAVTVSGGKGKTNTDSTYESVTKQAGIYAGKEGYDIQVKNNTRLKGAVIDSQAEKEKNKLTTGALTWENIENKAEYKAKAHGMTASTQSASKLNPAGLGYVPAVPVKGEADSTTYSAIADSIITTTKEKTEKEIRHDTENALNKLSEIFDKKKIEEKQELVNLMSQTGFTLIGDIADRKESELKRKAEEARKNNNSMEAETYEKAAGKWSESGTNRILLHGMLGAILSKEAGNGTGKGLTGAGLNAALQKELGKIKDKEVHKIASAAIGYIAGKETGAAIAWQATTYNWLSHEQYEQYKKELEEAKTEEEKKRVQRNWEAIDERQRYLPITTPGTYWDLKTGTSFTTNKGESLLEPLIVTATRAQGETIFGSAMSSGINAKAAKYLGRETIIGDALVLPWDIANDANIDKYGIQGVKRRIGIDIYGNLIVMFAGAKIGGIKGGSIGIFSVLGLTEIKEAIAPPLIENERKQADDSYLREINSNVID